MFRFLDYRYTVVTAMAAGLLQAIHAHGLGLPSQRLIAASCRISPATLSRRMKAHDGFERLVELIISARSQTHPPVAICDDTLPDWLPATEEEVVDAHVWAACEHLALRSETLAGAVVEVWQWERRRMQDHTLQGAGADPVVVEALHAMISGLTTRQFLEPGFDHAEAAAVLTAAAEAMGITP